MEDDATDQLDVEVAHAQLAPADLARRREHLGQCVIEDALEMLDVLLFALPAEFAAALGAVVAELFLGRLGRRGVLADLVAQLDHALADLGVGQLLEL